MQHYVERVIAWNAARYPQQSNHELSMKLLTEELGEFCDAQTEVEALDAIGDTMFVAIGALWKIGCSAEDIKEAFDALLTYDQNQVALVDKTHYYSTKLSRSGSLGLTGTIDDAILIATIVSTIASIIVPVSVGMGRFPQLNFIIEAICTSNETKAVPSTLVDPAVKANAGASGKGPNYVSPEADLAKIASLPKAYFNGSETHG